MSSLVVLDQISRQKYSVHPDAPSIFTCQLVIKTQSSTDDAFPHQHRGKRFRGILRSLIDIHGKSLFLYLNVVPGQTMLHLMRSPMPCTFLQIQEDVFEVEGTDMRWEVIKTTQPQTWIRASSCLRIDHLHYSDKTSSHLVPVTSRSQNSLLRQNQQLKRILEKIEIKRAHERAKLHEEMKQASEERQRAKEEMNQARHERQRAKEEMNQARHERQRAKEEMNQSHHTDNEIQVLGKSQPQKDMSEQIEQLQSLANQAIEAKQRVEEERDQAIEAKQRVEEERNQAIDEKQRVEEERNQAIEAKQRVEEERDQAYHELQRVGTSIQSVDDTAQNVQLELQQAAQQTSQAIEQRNEALEEKQRAEDERDEAHQELQRVKTEIQSVEEERDQAIEAKQRVEKERDQAIEEKQQMEQERDQAMEEKQQMEQERDQAMEVKQQMEQERDEAIEEKQQMEQERDEAMEEKQQAEQALKDSGIEAAQNKIKDLQLKVDSFQLKSRTTTGVVLNSALPLPETVAQTWRGLIIDQSPVMEEIVEYQMDIPTFLRFIYSVERVAHDIIHDKELSCMQALGYPEVDDNNPQIRTVRRQLQDNYEVWKETLMDHPLAALENFHLENISDDLKDCIGDFVQLFAACALNDPVIRMEKIDENHIELDESFDLSQVQSDQWLDASPRRGQARPRINIAVPALKRGKDLDTAVDLVKTYLLAIVE